MGRSYPMTRLLRPQATTPLVPFDSVGAGYSGAQSGSWTHNVGSSAKAVVVFGIEYSNTGSGNPSVSFGGTGMTLLNSLGGYGSTTLGGGAGFYVYVFAWGLLNPSTGTVTGSYSIPGGSGWNMTINSIAYDTVTGFGTTATTDGSGTAASQTVSSASGQAFVQAFAQYTSPSFTGYNQKSRWNSSSGYALNIGDAPGASSVHFAATAPASSPDWASIAVPLIL